MTRERSLSGTIPSMETAHDNLKDNTVIIGARLASAARPRTHRA